MGRRWYLGLVVASACGTEPVVETAVTYEDSVAPIVARHCAGCHRDGGIAPFSLTSYDAVVEQAQAMVHAITTGIMPPFYARETDDCAPRLPWRDDSRLSPDELHTLQTWIAAGHPRGDVRPPLVAPSTVLEGVTTTLAPVEPWVAAGPTDQFVCFVLDPATTDTTWLTGIHVRPSNPAVAHHVQIDEISGTASQLLVARYGIGRPYTAGCQTSPAQGGQRLVHLWTPGAGPLDLPGDQLAIELHPGSKLVVQIHYHPGNRVNDPDLTAIDLRLSTVVPRKRYFSVPVGNEVAAPFLQPSADEAPGSEPRFLIPAGAPDHIERIGRDVEGLSGLRDVRVVSVSPHMHYVGTQISTTITRPGAPAECLSNSGWSFDWQRTFIYDAALDELPTIANGDRIDVTCHWNNTMDNPGVLRMLAESALPPRPVDIPYGSNTTDEMCLETFGLAADVW